MFAVIKTLYHFSVSRLPCFSVQNYFCKGFNFLGSYKCRIKKECSELIAIFVKSIQMAKRSGKTDQRKNLLTD